MAHTEHIIRAFQIYLLLLSICALFVTLWVGPRINKLRFHGAHIYYCYVFILLLSGVQIKQVLEMLANPIGATWWYALFCKQLSLAVYLTIVMCIKSCKHVRGVS